MVENLYLTRIREKLSLKLNDSAFPLQVSTFLSGCPKNSSRGGRQNDSSVHLGNILHEKVVSIRSGCYVWGTVSLSASHKHSSAAHLELPKQSTLLDENPMPFLHREDHVLNRNRALYSNGSNTEILPFHRPTYIQLILIRPKSCARSEIHNTSRRMSNRCA